MILPWLILLTPGFATVASGYPHAPVPMFSDVALINNGCGKCSQAHGESLSELPVHADGDGDKSDRRLKGKKPDSS